MFTSNIMSSAACTYCSLNASVLHKNHLMLQQKVLNFFTQCVFMFRLLETVLSVPFVRYCIYMFLLLATVFIHSVCYRECIYVFRLLETVLIYSVVSNYLWVSFVRNCIYVFRLLETVLICSVCYKLYLCSVS